MTENIYDANNGGYTYIDDVLDSGHRASAVGVEAVRYGRQFTTNQGKLSVYSHGNINASKVNPFRGPQPYALDSAQMVYWCYANAGVELGGGSELVNSQRLRQDPKLTVVSTEGKKHLGLINDMCIGDLLFFGEGSKHVGIYCGGCLFISVNGSGDWDVKRGFQESDLTTDYWWSIFTGAVLRWE